MVAGEGMVCTGAPLGAGSRHRHLQHRRNDRRLRANLLDELHKQYVTTARAKGLPPGRLLLKYPLRMALNPFVADVGNLLPHVVSGSVIVSAVMSLQTTGPVLLAALQSQDMYLAGSFRCSSPF